MGRRIRAWKVASAALAAIITLAGCGSGNQPTSSAKENDPASVKIGVGGALSFTYLPSYVAVGKGYLNDELSKIGVKAELVDYNNSPTAVQALQSGQVQYLTSVVSTMLSADAQGAHIGQFFQVFNTDIAIPIIRSDLPTDAASLKDKRWGITAFGANNQVGAFESAKSLGISKDHVKLVAIGPPSAYGPALETNKIDIAMAGEPSADDLIIQGKAKLLIDLFDPAVSKKVYGGSYASSGLQADVSFVKSHPKLTAAVARAHMRAIKFVRDNLNTPDAIINSLPQQMRTQNIAAVLKRITPGLSTDGAVDPAAFDRVVKASKEAGVMDESASFNWKDLILTGYNK